jgi:metal-sulfur cluster biosynthetic enzyme
MTTLPIAPGAEARYAHEMSFAAVLRDTRGVRPLPPPPVFDSPPADLAERARRALFEVSDPEFPISIVDLGLVYGVRADDATGVVVVSLTYTTTACPCMDFIEWDVRERLLTEAGVSEVRIDVGWDPPWNTGRISERGRTILRESGVAV